MKTVKYSGALMVLAACGGSTSTTAEPAAPGAGEEAPSTASGADQCEELATTCHGHDQDNAPVAECHMLGHDADKAACSARYDECIAACKAAAEAHAHPAE